MNIALRAVLAIGFIAFASETLAQSIEATLPEGAATPSINRGADTVLWDNTDINTTTIGTISTIFGGLPPGTDRVNIADDFQVPAGRIWTITEVASIGFLTLGSPAADSFDVIFYADAGGQPGTEVATRNIPLGPSVGMETQIMAIPTPVQLAEGTYWISVAARFDTATDPTGGRWNWFTGTVPIGPDYHLQDTAGIFGGIPWTPATDLSIEPSASFVISGSDANALPPVPVSTTTPAGLAMLMILIMLAGGLVVRRIS